MVINFTSQRDQVTNAFMEDGGHGVQFNKVNLIKSNDWRTQPQIKPNAESLRSDEKLNIVSHAIHLHWLFISFVKLNELAMSSY